jgi:hypothetical protein
LKRFLSPPAARQKSASAPREQEAEVVARGGGKQYIDLVAFDAFEVIAAEMAFILR